MQVRFDCKPEKGGIVTHAQEMLQTHPGPAAVDEAALVECIEACYECAQSCTACADACLGEDDPKSLSRCVRLNLDCADICGATGRVVSRQTGFEPQLVRAMLRACVEACRLCGEECEQHGQHGMEHCRVCAEACRRCEQACDGILSAIPA